MKKNNEVVLSILCSNIYNYIHKNTINFIKIYEIEYKNLLLDLEILKINKPLKIFKKKYIKWENDILNKEKEILEVIKKINNELKDLKYKD